MEASDYARSGYAPKDQSSVLANPGNSRETRINMISSITNQGQVRFMLYGERMTAEVFIRFLSRLIRDGRKKVLTGCG